MILNNRLPHKKDTTGKFMIKHKWPAIAVLLVTFFITGLGHALTKDEVEKRGFLQCGVSTGIPGFSVPDEKGNWSGMDVDICRAVAAAVLGDSHKVKFIPLADDERFTALQAGDVDILARNSSWTFIHDSSLALNFTGIYFFDGQGFLVPKKLGIKSVSNLGGVQLCVQPGTAQEIYLTNFFTSKKLEYKPIFFNSFAEAVKGYKEGKCSALTHKQTILYGLKEQMKSSLQSDVLPETIAKEPLSPVVRQGDDAWFNIVRWTLYLLINAEEEGVSSATINDVRAGLKADGEYRVGVTGTVGVGLGLSDDWAYKVIEQVGNYDELFNRNLGENSVLKMERGPNRLWSQGGLLYAPPLR